MKGAIYCLPSMLFFSSGLFAAEWININTNNFNSYINSTPHKILAGKNNQFKLQSTITLSNNVTKHKFIQYYKGVPVFASILSSTGEGNEDWWGNYLADIEQDLTDVNPSMTAEEALTLGKNTVLTKNLITSEKAQLYVMMDKKSNKAKLVYLVSFLVNQEKPSRPHFIVDAHSKQVLQRWEGLTTRDAQGPGGNQKTGAYYYGRDFGPLSVSNSCEMKTDNVETYNLNGKTSGEVLFKFTCPENKFKTINGAYSPLNDAHYFGGIVFEMYKNWYNLSPLKTKLKLRVHYGQNYENAFWDGTQMTFGDGGSSLYPLTSLDVVAHEVSHGVTEQNSNLIYQYQSGGINEAFSDMAGEVAEYYMQSQIGKENDWMVGSSIIKGPAGSAMRYFDHPSRDKLSIEHARNYNDSLDVHHTSGVYNKAFYTLATKNNWGIRKAFEVFLVANQIYWSANATFDSAACGVVKAADDLNYEISDVISSFAEVGVNGNCITPDPTPDPIPDPKEGELSNGQIINSITVGPNQERRFKIKVPSVKTYPYTYKYLIIRLFNDKNNVKDLAELFVRYDFEKLLPNTPYKAMEDKDEFFYVPLPPAGFYHILLKGKQTGALSLQAYYGN